MLALPLLGSVACSPGPLGAEGSDASETAAGADEASDATETTEDTETETDTGEPGDPRPELTVTPAAFKTFSFSWTQPSWAESYQLLEQVEPGAPYLPLGPQFSEASQNGWAATMPLHLRGAARYKLRACVDEDCFESEPSAPGDFLRPAIAYLKASSPDPGDDFGEAIAISDDGLTFAVAAVDEDSTSPGINGDSSDNLGERTGAAYVFVRDADNTQWSQQAYVKADEPGNLDRFGSALDLSGDGDTLAVAARGWDGDGQYDIGAVYVFEREATGWTQTALIPDPTPDSQSDCGRALALDAAGDTLALGCPGEFDHEGRVHVLQREGSAWVLEQTLRADVPGADEHFGARVVLDASGETIATTAWNEKSMSAGVHVLEPQGAPEASVGSGAVYVFSRDPRAEAWSQRAYIKPQDPGVEDLFGLGLALSGDGTTLTVGSPGDDAEADGVGGDPLANAISWSGSAYVYARAPGSDSWVEQVYITPLHAHYEANFGASAALSADGDLLAIGMTGDWSAAVGVDGDPHAPSSDAQSGAVLVYVRDPETQQWSERAYLKAPEPGAGDAFGSHLAMTPDGASLLVSAHHEDGGSSGIGGDQADDSAPNAGAVYVY